MSNQNTMLMGGFNRLRMKLKTMRKPSGSPLHLSKLAASLVVDHTKFINFDLIPIR